MERPLGTIEQPTVLPIIDIKQETETVKTFFFNIELKSKPGQFVIMWIPRVNEKPFSIAFDKDKKLGLSISNVGPFTEKLFAFKTGDQVGIRGPYGSWFVLKQNYKKILLIGGGYGVAPLANLAKQAEEKGIEVDFCNGARTKNLLLFQKHLNDLNINLHIATDDGSLGKKCFVTNIASSCLKKESYDCVYVCGPEIMEKKIVDLCAEKKLPCQVSIERYMKCGFGICGQCCLDDTGERMCQEGPVIAGKRALKNKEFGQYKRVKSGKKEYF